MTRLTLATRRFPAGVAQQLAMGAKDGGLIFADGRAEALDDFVEFVGGRGTGTLKTSNFRGQVHGGEQIDGGTHRDLIEPVSASNGHAGGNGNAFVHTGILRPQLR